MLKPLRRDELLTLASLLERLRYFPEGLQQSEFDNIDSIRGAVIELSKYPQGPIDITSDSDEFVKIPEVIVVVSEASRKYEIDK